MLPLGGIEVIAIQFPPPFLLFFCIVSQFILARTGTKATGATLELKASKCPSSTLALTNCVFLHPDDALTLTPIGATEAPENNYLTLKNFVYTFKVSNTTYWATPTNFQLNIV